MKLLRTALCAAAAFLIIFAAPICAVAASPAIPAKPTADIYCVDKTGVLAQSTVDSVVADSTELKRLTGAEIAVVIVPSLGGASAFDYSLAILRGWGVGDKDKDNGVVMLISTGDREVFIQIGYGLEGRINDAKAGRIIDDEMTPYLKDGDYDSGVYFGYQALLREAAAEYGISADFSFPPPTVSPDPAVAGGKAFVGSPLFWILIIALFLFDWIFLHGAITRALFWILAIFGRTGGRGGGSGRWGGGSWGGGGRGGSFGGGSGGGGGAGRRF